MHTNDNGLKPEDLISQLINNLFIPGFIITIMTTRLSKDVVTLEDYIAIGLAVTFGVLLIVFQSRLKTFYVWIILLFKGVRTAIIFDYVKVSIEFLDKTGSDVSFRRHDFISSLTSKKLKNINPVEIFCATGSITDISVINCYPQEESEKCVFFHYSPQDSHGKEGAHFYFSGVFKNAFLGHEEYWEIKALHYINFYRLQVIIPEKTVLDEDLRQGREIDSNGKKHLDWDSVPGRKILKYQVQGKTIIYTYLSAVRPGQRFRLQWKVD